MPADLARTLVWEAQRHAPNEMCGFVMNNWSYEPVKNCHAEPDKHFSMDQEHMLRLLANAGHLVVGVYHSHPRGRKEPSENDVSLMRMYAPHGFRFWIVTYNNVYEWRLHRDKPAPVRPDGSTGSTELAYPVLTVAAPL